MKITKKQQYILGGGGVLLVSIAIAVPLIVQSTKQTTISFNLSIIKSHMQTATNNKATLAETKVAIVNMYQNGTTAKLSPQAQKAAHALAQYIYANKTRQKFAFVLGKDHQDHHLLLLTIANHSAKPKGNAFLQRVIRQVSISTQKQENPFSVKQLSWITSALHKAEFGILFWIYQHRLSGQEAIAGTSIVPTQITAVNFQRVKTPHEKLQDQAWAKMMQVVRNLTSSQLKIHVNAQQFPSQTKITASHIVLAIQNIITNDDALSKATSKLIKEDNIEVQPNDKTGAMMITIKNYGPAKIITIFGFKATTTPLEIARAKIKDAKNGASLPTKLNQVSHGQMPTTSDVSVPMKEGVIFKFQSATAINNKGESTLTYEVDANPQVKGTTLKDITFVVSGFETKVQAVERITAQAKIDVAQDGVNLPTRFSQVFQGQAPTASDVNAPTKDGVTFKFQLATAINNKGESTLTYEVNADPQVKGTILKDITFVVSGFETKVQATERITAQAKISAAQDGVNLPTRLNQVFHDKTPTASDVNAPIKNGVTFKFKEATAINNKGESTLTYEVDADPQVDGTTSQDVTFVVSGFETNDQKDAREVIKKRLDTTMQNIHDGALVIPNGITSSQFNEYVQAMGDVFHKRGYFVMNKFAEQYRVKITSLSIPNSFTTIGSWFKHFNKITSLTLNDNLQTIGGSAFYQAKLKMLTIPDAVTTIEARAFYSSPLISLTLGAKLQTIGNYAFYHIKLKVLTIPNAVTTIGLSAFENAQLTSLRVPDAVTTIEARAFASSPLTSLTLGAKLKTIGDNAFQNAKLKMLSIPNLVTTIGAYTFASSPLTSLTLGAKLQTIGDNAFQSAKLKMLTIPNAVTAIGTQAFASSPLTSLTLGAKLQTIGNSAFKSAQLTLLRIPNAVITIGLSAFENAQLTSLRVPDAVTTIGVEAFASSPLTSLTLGEALKTIGDNAFQNAKLKMLSIPNLVTTIGSQAFYSSPLTSLTLNDNLQTIGGSAFYQAKLKMLTIPDAVTTIGAEAFASSPLTSLTLGEALQTIGDNAFQSAKLKMLTIPDAVTTIGNGAFASSPLANVKVFDNVKLGTNAFKAAIKITTTPRPTKPTL